MNNEQKLVTREHRKLNSESTNVWLKLKSTRYRAVSKRDAGITTSTSRNCSQHAWDVMLWRKVQFHTKDAKPRSKCYYTYTAIDFMEHHSIWTYELKNMFIFIDCGLKMVIDLMDTNTRFLIKKHCFKKNCSSNSSIFVSKDHYFSTSTSLLINSKY